MSKLLSTVLTATCALSLAATGCIKQDAPPDEIARAIPTAEQVRIKLPNSGKTLGDLANYYVVTRDVTRTLNGGTAWVLVLIHSIVQYPVTSTNGNVYTWGPWSDALAPAEYKLDVTANADGTFDYQLSGRNKTVSGSQFEVVIDGHADPRPGDLQGNGDFQLDFDAGRRVNPVDSGDAKGKVTVQYDLAARHLDMLAQAPDANGNPAMFEYAYNETLDGGGDMVFNATADAGGTALPENIVIRSRWQGDGAGRGDARLAGGDLGTAQAIASECWSTLFRRVYYTDNATWQPTEGDVAQCAYGTADLPPLD
ncbi:MAG TPA: hypothetical protein VFV99_26090 [Kofleriaceae bacterium]|nr:hypothetical protein [Kofleriaceae bacterium]